MNSIAFGLPKGNSMVDDKNFRRTRTLIGVTTLTRLVSTLPVVAGCLFGLPAIAETVESVIEANAPLTTESINAASLPDFDVINGESATDDAGDASSPGKELPSPSIARLQILLDRAGASPGVIDGLYGSNLRKAIAGFEMMRGLPANGELDVDDVKALESPEQVIGSYTITAKDSDSVVANLPEDYGELAKLDYLGFTSIEEELAERFHMDIDFLRQLNPGSDFKEGETISVADVGSDQQGTATRVDVDKEGGQVRAYSQDGDLLAAYPATIGSESNPSPSGSHMVKVIVKNPTYTYNPKINFQQGANKRVLTLAPGPNNPVGSVWIDLSEPTYGIHGTPEPSRIDKTGSHGCVRLTNWDAQELAKMLSKGVPVKFIDR